MCAARLVRRAVLKRAVERATSDYPPSFAQQSALLTLVSLLQFDVMAVIEKRQEEEYVFLEIEEEMVASKLL